MAVKNLKGWWAPVHRPQFRRHRDTLPGMMAQLLGNPGAPTDTRTAIEVLADMAERRLAAIEAELASCRKLEGLT